MANMNLHPYVKQQAEKFLENANKRLTGDWQVFITQGLRTMEEQAAIYGQGRHSSKDTVYKGKDYANPNGGKIVSGAKPGQSMHNYGLALDIALKNTKTGAVIWDIKKDGDHDGKADWMEAVEEAKKQGFSWGGDWKSFPDYPHFEINFGLDWRDLYAGKKPPTLEEITGKKADKPGPKGSDSVKYPGKVLKVGSKGIDVKRVQRAVGLPESKVDGVFGKMTENAVKAYQKKHKLKIDGQVGPKTWSVMF